MKKIVAPGAGKIGRSKPGKGLGLVEKREKELKALSSDARQISCERRRGDAAVEAEAVELAKEGF